MYIARLATCANYGVELGTWKLGTGSNLRSIWRFGMEITAPFQLQNPSLWKSWDGCWSFWMMRSVDIPFMDGPHPGMKIGQHL